MTPNKYQAALLELVDTFITDDLEYAKFAEQATDPLVFRNEYLTLKFKTPRRSGQSTLTKFIAERYPDLRVAVLCPTPSIPAYKAMGLPDNTFVTSDPLRLRGRDIDLILLQLEGHSSFAQLVFPGIFHIFPHPRTRMIVIG